MTDHVATQYGPSIPALSKLMEFTPRTLVLDVLAVSGGTPMTSPALALSGEIMGFKAGAIRVAISRLAAQNVITSPRRGSWRLAENAPWAREQGRWRNIGKLLCSWDHTWWVAVTHQVSRSNRGTWRAHERALWQRGFCEVQRDLFVRPANLTLTFDALGLELTDLGMAPETLMLHASTLSARPRPNLWDFRRRHALLKKLHEEMCQLLKAAPSNDQASKLLCARFLRVGRAATKTLNTDPLLPEEWTGPSPRAEVARLLPRFINTGRARWLRHLSTD